MTNQGQVNYQNQGQKPIPTRVDAYWAYRRNNEGVLPAQPSLELSVTSRITTPTKNETRQLLVQQTNGGKSVIRFSLPIEGEKPISQINTELKMLYGNAATQFPTDKTLYLEVSVMGYSVEKFQKREYLVGDRVALVVDQIKLYEYQSQDGQPRVKLQGLLKTDLQADKWRSAKVQQELDAQKQMMGQQTPNANPSFGGGFGGANTQQSTNQSFGGGFGGANTQQSNPSFGGGFGGANTQQSSNQSFGGGFGGVNTQQSNSSFSGGFGGVNTQQSAQDFGAGLSGAPTMPNEFGATPSGAYGVDVNDNDLPF